jgi:hypothetical protein
MPREFYDRHFPVRPNLEQLKHQAKDLLRAFFHLDFGFQQDEYRSFGRASYPAARLTPAPVATAKSWSEVNNGSANSPVSGDGPECTPLRRNRIGLSGKHRPMLRSRNGMTRR